MLMPATAAGWGTLEHQQIGSVAYTQACAELTASAAAMKSPAPGIATRLEIACGRNVATTADIYGDATAIAGDFSAIRPSSCRSRARGGSRARGATTCWRWRTAPTSTRCRRSRGPSTTARRSTRRWPARARTAGWRSFVGFSSRFRERVCRSLPAGLIRRRAHGIQPDRVQRRRVQIVSRRVEHRGRIVSDRNGDRWVTFGTGGSIAPKTKVGADTCRTPRRCRCATCCARSCSASAPPTEELAVWRALPFTIQAPEMNVGVVELFKRKEEPTSASSSRCSRRSDPSGRTRCSRPACGPRPRFRSHDGVIAVVAGFELAVPRVPAQSYLGAGGTLREGGRALGGGRHRPAVPARAQLQRPHQPRAQHDGVVGCSSTASRWSFMPNTR